MTLTGLSETLAARGVQSLEFIYAEGDRAPRSAQIRSADGATHTLAIEKFQGREELEARQARLGPNPRRVTLLDSLSSQLHRLRHTTDEDFARMRTLFGAFQQEGNSLLGRVEQIAEYNYLVKLVDGCVRAPYFALGSSTGSEAWDRQLFEEMHALEPEKSRLRWCESRSTNSAVQKEREESRVLHLQMKGCFTEERFRALATGIEKFPEILLNLPQHLLHLVEKRHYRHLSSSQIQALGFERCYPLLSCSQLEWTPYEEISQIRDATFINDRDRFPKEALMKIHPEMVRELLAERKEELVQLLVGKRPAPWSLETQMRERVREGGEEEPLPELGIAGEVEELAADLQAVNRNRPEFERETLRRGDESKKKELHEARRRLIPQLSLEEFFAAQFPQECLAYIHPDQIQVLWANSAQKAQLIEVLRHRDTGEEEKIRLIGSLIWDQFVEAQFPPHYIVYINPELVQGLEELHRGSLFRELKAERVSHTVRSRIIRTLTWDAFAAAKFPDSFILYINPSLIPAFGLGGQLKLLCREIQTLTETAMRQYQSRDAEHVELKRAVFTGFSDEQLRYFAKGAFWDSSRIADYLPKERLNALERISFSDSKRYRELTDEQMVNKIIHHYEGAPSKVFENSAEVILRLVNLWEKDPRSATRGPLEVSLRCCRPEELVQLEPVLDKIAEASFDKVVVSEYEAIKLAALPSNGFRRCKKMFATLSESAFPHDRFHEITDEQLSWFGPEILKFIPLDRIRQAVSWTQLWHVTAEQAKRLSWPKWCVYKIFSWWKGLWGGEVL